jgi:hypothetical protein
MEPTVTLDAFSVSEGIVVWTGWGDAAWPARDDARLVERFGAEMAVEIAPRIRQLEDDFYASNARFTISDLRHMGDVAADEFRKIHPEISDDAVKALTWCYMYDHK